jgi:hypothetical protein
MIKVRGKSVSEETKVTEVGTGKEIEIVSERETEKKRKS